MKNNPNPSQLQKAKGQTHSNKQSESNEMSMKKKSSAGFSTNWKSEKNLKKQEIQPIKQGIPQKKTSIPYNPEAEHSKHHAIKISSPKNSLAAKGFNKNIQSVQKQKIPKLSNSCQQCEDLRRKHQDMEAKFQQIQKRHQEQLQAQKSQIEEFDSQKEEIMKKLKMFEILKAQNKKLIREKADKYNESGQVKRLMSYIAQLQGKIQRLGLPASSLQQFSDLKLQSRMSQPEQEEEQFIFKLSQSSIEQNNNRKKNEKSDFQAAEAHPNLLLKLAEMEQELLSRQKTISRLQKEKEQLKKQYSQTQGEAESYKSQIVHLRRQNMYLKNNLLALKTVKSQNLEKQSRQDVNVDDMLTQFKEKRKKSSSKHSEKFQKLNAIMENQKQVLKKMSKEKSSQSIENLIKKYQSLH